MKISKSRALKIIKKLRMYDLEQSPKCFLLSEKKQDVEV